MFSGLSCYTANLLAYLDSFDDTALDRFADSVRLAVRPDDLAFSHHRTPLDVLPDGSLLRYAAGPGWEAELDRWGRVVVAVDNARLPWSPSYGTSETAPHWLLVTGRDGDSWRVVDHFAGLLPTGEQQPFEGTLSTEVLLRAMDGPEVLSPVQARRNSLVFGHVVAVPEGGRKWLRREVGAAVGVASGPRLHSPTGVRRSPAEVGQNGGRWLVGAADVVPFLSDLFRRDPAVAAGCLDDLWSAAGHHVFRYRRAGVEDAADAWRQLPGALRFAVDSARRGRPRESLVELTFRNLLHIESGQDGVLPSRGRTAR
ncbi:hypothetical protein DFJ66_7631 [Saccharothrix variisporea]|uniref:Butirosin biosynthesis protein H N-terminal domain-containing protein n=1 Tax=Saccharothrix variisporea TaxID=543527 RepID=A0A495XJL1_9PSEU|nr:hypothetical protein DFJ66_7631 [Saccharothrix variisporea]